MVGYHRVIHKIKIDVTYTMKMKCRILKKETVKRCAISIEQLRLKNARESLSLTFRRC